MKKIFKIARCVFIGLLVFNEGFAAGGSSKRRRENTLFRSNPPTKRHESMDFLGGSATKRIKEIAQIHTIDSMLISFICVEKILKVLKLNFVPTNPSSFNDTVYQWMEHLKLNLKNLSLALENTEDTIFENSENLASGVNVNTEVEILLKGDQFISSNEQKIILERSQAIELEREMRLKKVRASSEDLYATLTNLEQKMKPNLSIATTEFSNHLDKIKDKLLLLIKTFDSSGLRLKNYKDILTSKDCLGCVAIQSEKHQLEKQQYTNLINSILQLSKENLESVNTDETLFLTTWAQLLELTEDMVLWLTSNYHTESHSDFIQRIQAAADIMGSNFNQVINVSQIQEPFYEFTSFNTQDWRTRLKRAGGVQFIQPLSLTLVNHNIKMLNVMLEDLLAVVYNFFTFLPIQDAGEAMRSYNPGILPFQNSAFGSLNSKQKRLLAESLSVNSVSNSLLGAQKAHAMSRQDAGTLSGQNSVELGLTCSEFQKRLDESHPQPLSSANNSLLGIGSAQSSYVMPVQRAGAPMRSENVGSLPVPNSGFNSLTSEQKQALERFKPLPLDKESVSFLDAQSSLDVSAKDTAGPSQSKNPPTLHPQHSVELGSLGSLNNVVDRLLDGHGPQPLRTENDFLLGAQSSHPMSEQGAGGPSRSKNPPTLHPQHSVELDSFTSVDNRLLFDLHPQPLGTANNSLLGAQSSLVD